MNLNASTSATSLYRELVMLVEGEGITSSRMVAARFGKSHTHALRKLDQVIKAVCAIEPGMAALMFRDGSYTDTRGRTQREVQMTHDGFMMLAMRFTGEAATRWQLQFIAAFKWLATLILDRAENNRLIAQFDIKNRQSIESGSHHGAGLQRRKTEKVDLATEEAQLRAKVQAAFLLDGSPPALLN